MKWKTIEGFENYEVSDMGNIRNRKTGRVLKSRADTGGYLQVCLSVNGKVHYKTVHRLVALAFIPNPDHKPEINHIDEEKTNNRVENLNWVTRFENNNYGSRVERTQKAVYVIYPDGTKKYYPSVTIAGKELTLFSSGIVNVLKGRYKTTGGLRFEYA